MGRLFNCASVVYRKGSLNRMRFFRNLRFEYTYRLNNGWGGSEFNRKIARDLIRFIDTKGFKSALDLGCGYGWVAHELSQFIPSVVGVDISETALDEARKNIGGVKFEKRDIVDFCEGKYDLIMCNSSLNYVPRRYARKIAHNLDLMLNRNGHLVIVDAVSDNVESNFDTDTIEYVRYLNYPFERRFVYIPTSKRHFSVLTVSKTSWNV